MRLTMILCVLSGIFLWNIVTPTPLFLHTDALRSSNIKLLTYAAKNTYFDNVCSTHPLVTSCPCGEEWNSAVKSILNDYVYEFDPLERNQTSKVKALSIYLSMVIVTVLLTESVSHLGVFIGVLEWFKGLKIGQLIGLLTWIESNPEEKNPSIQLLYAP